MKKLFTPSFISLGISFFFFIFGIALFDVLPKHFKTLEFIPSQIGFIMSGHGIGGLIVIPVLIFIMDRVPIKRIIILGYFLFAIASLPFFFSDWEPALYMIPRLFQGIFFTMMMISFVTEVSHVVPSKVRLAGFAIFGLMGQIPGSLSIIWAEFLLNQEGIFWVLISSFVSFGISFVLLLFIKERKNNKNAPSDSQINKPQPKLADFLPIIKNKKLFPYFFWVLCLGYTFGTILSFLPQVLESNGLSEIRDFFIFYPITVIAIRLLFSRFFDKASRYKVIGLPIICLPISLLFLPEVTCYTLLIIPGILYGIAHGVLFPVLTASMIDFSPNHFRGRMTLLFQTFLNLGLFLAANIGGIIGDVSIDWTYWSAAIFVSLGTLVFLALSLRKLRKKSLASK
jgi:MFS family permease